MFTLAEYSYVDCVANTFSTQRDWCSLSSAPPPLTPSAQLKSHLLIWISMNHVFNISFMKESLVIYVIRTLWQKVMNFCVPVLTFIGMLKPSKTRNDCSLLFSSLISNFQTYGCKHGSMREAETNDTSPFLFVITVRMFWFQVASGFHHLTPNTCLPSTKQAFILPSFVCVS